MTAVRRADGVRAARVARLRVERVVAALAERRADGVHGRQVDDVEPHLRDRRQPPRRRAEGARAPGAVRGLRRALGAGEQLVPAAGQRQRAAHAQRVRRAGRDELAQRGAVQRVLDRRRRRHREPCLGRSGVVGQLPRRGRERGRVLGRPGSLRVRGHDALEEPAALGEHEVDVLARLELDDAVVRPGGVRVGPRLDAERPVRARVGDGVRLQVPAETVQAGRDVGHRGGGVVRAVRGDEDGGRRHGVVPLAEDGGLDGDDLTHGGLRRPAAALDHGRELQHGDPADRRVRCGLRRRHAHHAIQQVIPARAQVPHGRGVQPLAG